MLIIKKLHFKVVKDTDVITENAGVMAALFQCFRHTSSSFLQNENLVVELYLFPCKIWAIKGKCLYYHKQENPEFLTCL